MYSYLMSLAIIDLISILPSKYTALNGVNFFLYLLQHRNIVANDEIEWHSEFKF